MGREVLRVPVDFDWPINKPWYDAVYVKAPECWVCDGSGYSKLGEEIRRHGDVGMTWLLIMCFLGERAASQLSDLNRRTADKQASKVTP